MADPTTVLTLDTTAARRTVVIDGHAYELRNIDEFSLLDYQRIASKGKRIETLMQRDSLDDAEAKDLSAIADAVCRMVLDAPDPVHAQLRDPHRMAIVMAFTRLPLPMGLATAAASRPAGANSSPRSPGSMGGAPANGTRRRRSRSSAPVS